MCKHLIIRFSIWRLTVDLNDLNARLQVDGLSDDTKMETQRDIHQRATDELAENELETQIHLTFYLVSLSLINYPVWCSNINVSIVFYIFAAFMMILT